MSYALSARLRKLEELAQPSTTGADVRRHLRSGLAEAPDHARALVARWRCAVAALEADAGGTLDDVLARLIADGFVVDGAMAQAAADRLTAGRQAALEAGCAVDESHDLEDL